MNGPHHEHITQVVTVVQACRIPCSKIFLKEVPRLSVVGSIALIRRKSSTEVDELVYGHAGDHLRLEARQASLVEEVLEVL